MKRILSLILATVLSLCGLTVCSAQEGETQIKGDVNLNGRIDSRDYLLLKRAYFGTTELSEQAKELADINDNDKIDSRDYMLLKRIYFGTYSVPQQDNFNSGGDTDNDNTQGDNTGNNNGGNNNGDNTSGDNTSGDNTSGDNTSGDNTSGDNTSGDNTDDNTQDDPAQVEIIGQDILLCYISEEYRDISISKETFLPAVGYTVDGEIKDYMFESFIFLCQPNYLYDWDSNGSAYLKPFTKSDWTEYIANEELKSNKNISALDAAVGEVKTALGDADYKAKVYMTLFYPVTDVTNFGEVNGKNLNLSKLEDRYTAMEWMVDESIRQFNAKNFQNIELAGFYWFCEEMYETSGDGLKIVKHTTDYVREKGLITTWCPYYLASKYNVWKSLGFDIATMQANYFPAHRTDWPNKGGPERLNGVANAHKDFDLGVGMEMADSETASAIIFKEYMKAAIEKDFMQTDHIYYMSTGPAIVKTLANSSDSILRTTYDELYKYIHRTLKVSDITFSDEPAKEPTVLTDKSALFAGDSICEGGSDWNHDLYSDLRGWAGRIAFSNMMASADNVGVGYTTVSNFDTQDRHLINQLKSVANKDYDYVILQGGVNDAWNNVTIGTVTDGFDGELDQSTFAGGLEATFKYAKETFPDAIIGFIINFDVTNSGVAELQNLGEYFDIAKEVCEKWDVPYLDLFNNAEVGTALKNTTTEYLEDGVHPNSAGYDVLYPFIEEWMLGLE